MTDEPSPAYVQALLALQNQPSIYAGTVPFDEVRRRRAKNKVARASRRANRKK